VSTPFDNWLDEQGIPHTPLNLRETRSVPLSLEDIATITMALDIASNADADHRERFTALINRLRSVVLARLFGAVDPRDPKTN
jgi:hypothetical protein